MCVACGFALDGDRNHGACAIGLTCQMCGATLPRLFLTCKADPCPFCRYPRPVGDCSDLS